MGERVGSGLSQTAAEMPKPRAEAKPDDEFVTIAQVTELLQQQKEMFLLLLKQQQEIFSGFVNTIMDKTGTKMEYFTRELQDLKTSLQFTQKEVDDIKAALGTQKEDCSSIRTDLFKVCDSMLTVTDKMDYLESQSRRNNLVIEGVVESPDETWKDTELKVGKVLREKLKIQREIEMERAHRTGKPKGERPRPIVVKLQRFKDKSDILQRTKALKGTNIYINEDYTDAVKTKRRELMPKLREARQRGNIAFLRYDKLIVHPRSSTPIPQGDKEDTD